MNKIILQNTLRFVGLLFLQVLILKRMEMGSGVLQYLSILLYPLAVMLLPIRTPVFGVLLLAFVQGLLVDIFYDSPGVHASANVFMAFMRPVALGLMEPREGYSVNYSPTKSTLGIRWFISYAAILMGLFLFFYFSVEAFTFVYIGNILLKTVVSFIGTMIFIFIFMAIFDPEQ